MMEKTRQILSTQRRVRSSFPVAMARSSAASAKVESMSSARVKLSIA
jgi:hypothetical protein